MKIKPVNAKEHATITQVSCNISQTLQNIWKIIL